MKGIAKAALTVFLGTCWTWAGFLKDKNLIGDDTKFVILIVFTALLIIQQVHAAWPKPVARGMVEAQRPVIQSYLGEFLKRYYDQRSLLVPAAGTPLPCVRANVMLPTKSSIIGDGYLKIYHAAGPPNITYNDDEFSEEWKATEGTSGWAWKHGERSIYDSKDPKFSGPALRLTDSQRLLTQHLNSTLSMPIWDNDKNKVVGVLNLDSEQNLEESLFHHATIIDSAEACAQHLVAHCFTHGVAAK